MTENVPATVFGGNVNIEDMQALAARAQQSAQNNPRGGAPGDSDYMNFSGKAGSYTVGQDKREVPDDELWIVNITSFQEGWVCWKGGQPAATRLANIYNEPAVAQPDFNEFGPFDREGDGWFQAKAMVMRSVDEDQQGYFKINSVSGVSSMAELIGACAKRMDAGTACWPVVRLKKEKFTSKGFTNFKPIFEVQGWLDNDQLVAFSNGDADIEELLEAGDDPAALPEPEPEPEPKPARGRRRTRD